MSDLLSTAAGFGEFREDCDATRIEMSTNLGLPPFSRQKSSNRFLDVRASTFLSDVTFLSCDRTACPL